MFKKVQIVSVKSELGAGTRGSSLGFDALRIASLHQAPAFFENREPIDIETLNSRLYKKADFKFAKHLDGVVKMYEYISKELLNQYQRENFPVLISGDHSNAGGTIAGIKKAYPNKRLGVIWIDAHADLHSPYTSPSGNIHGMPLATALSDDNLECKNNEPHAEVSVFWNQLKGATPRIKHSDLFFIGVRDTEAPEEAIMSRHNIPNVTVDEMRAIGVKATADKALEHLKDCDLIYVSFDVDSMDPSISIGTGTPVPHGLSEEEAQELLLNLVDDDRLCCFETTEINPLLDDKGNAMAEAAFRVIKPVIEKIEQKVKG